jgi:hypothetical protein
VIVDLIGIQSGRIDHPLCADLFASIGEQGYTIHFLDGLDGEVYLERHPIDHCLCRARQWNREGTEYPFARDEHSTQGTVSEMRLALIDLFRTDDTDI